MQKTLTESSDSGFNCTSYPPKIILHLCADLGSDSLFYQLSGEYQVIMVGEEIGVENYTPPPNVHGIIANPVCTEFSTASGFHKKEITKKEWRWLTIV
jgi:hypothetical protein